MLTSSYEESRWSPVQKLASSTLKPEASLNLQSNLNVSIFEQLMPKVLDNVLSTYHASRRRAALPQNNEACQLEKWKMD
jgi:hypothetical protein